MSTNLKQIIDSSTIGEQSVKYAESAGSLTNLTNIENGSGTGSLQQKNVTIPSGEKAASASGLGAVAFGVNTEASAKYTFASGHTAKATKEGAHAEGIRTTAQATGAHAEGADTTASGNRAHAEGNTTKASGEYSHSEGTNTEATAMGAHAEGARAKANGNASHAEGADTIASGNRSHAEGEFTIAAGSYQHVQGKYNIADNANTYAHIVGNGDATTRSNAHTIDWSGNGWFAGNVTIGANKKALATKDEVETATSYATTRNNILFVENGANNITNRNLTSKVIVNFGDSIFGKSRPPEDVSTELANLTGSTVHNCAFGGCRMAQHTGHWDAFAMYRLVDAIISKDWSLQDAALNYDDRPSYAEEPLALLKSIDFTKVNIITIAYGTNDWASASGKLDNTSNKLDIAYFGGALRYSIERLLEAFPNLQIFVVSATYRCWYNSDGSFKEDITTKTLADLHLSNYVEKARDIAKEYFVPFIDNFYELGINKHNHAHYFANNDGTHHIAAGRKLIAEHMAKELF